MAFCNDFYNVDKKKEYVFLFFLILIVFVVYGNTINFGFVTDDYDQIVDDKKIKKLQNLLDFFFSPIPNSVSTQYYRPIFRLSLSVDYFIWKLNPTGYHLTNVFLYCVFLVCSFKFIKNFVNENLIVFLISLLFTVHPTHSETVSWVAARNEILMGIFFVLSCICFIKFSKNGDKRNLMFSYISFIMAILSKETAIVLPVILFFYEIFFNNTNIKKKILIFFPYLVFLVFYTILRMILLDSPFGDPAPIVKRLYTFFLIEKEYIKLLVLPLNLKVIYYNLIPYPPKVSFNLLFSIALFVFFTLFMLYYYKRDKVVSFFMLFYLLTNLPASGLLAIIRVSPIADRYLFLPSLGFIIFTIQLFKKRILKEKIFNYSIIILICVIITFSLVTVKKNKDYQNNFFYLSKMVEHAPDYYEGLNGLGVEFLNRGDFINAEKFFLKAIELSVPDTFRVYLNLGTLYTKMNNIEEAKKSFIKVIENEKDNELKSIAFYNLSIIYFNEGDFNSAEYYIKKSIELDNNNANFYNNLGVIYFTKGEIEEAKKMFLKALTIDPEHEDSIKNLKILK